jgi:hypothetical protein
LLRADGEQRQRCLAAQALQRLDLFVALDGAFVEGNAARGEQRAAFAAGSAVVAAVQRDREALCHLPQFVRQPRIGRGAGAALRSRGGFGAGRGRAVGERDLAVLVDLAVDRLRHGARGNEHKGEAGQAMQ